MKPCEFLQKLISGNVEVKVKVSEREYEVYRGKLISYDEHMNLLLFNAVKMENGRKSLRYGTILIRGASVIMIRSLDGH